MSRPLPACGSLPLRFIEVPQQRLLGLRARIAAGELDRARGVTQHLHALQTADVVEEPAARSKTAERVALHLQQLQRPSASFGIRFLSQV